MTICNPDPHLLPLVAWYESLTVDTVGRVGEFYTVDAHFRDPFNDVRGRAAIEQVFAHMFVQVREPRFAVKEIAQGEASAVLLWTFSFAGGSADGASHLHFDAEGMICVHRDYWDPVAELLMPRPILGALPRWLYHRLSAQRAG